MKKLVLLFVVISGLLANCGKANSIPKSNPTLNLRIDELIANYTEEGKFSGSVLIAEKGFVVLNKGYGYADYEREFSNTPQTQYSIGSVTKLFTCAAIRMETDTGATRQDDTLAKYIPDYPRGDEITITQLLNHTSGIADLFNDLGYDTLPLMSDPITFEDLIERFKYERLEFEPGSKYDYSNSGYSLLAYIIEQASGISYNQYIEKEVFIPLEMSNSVADWDKGFSNKAIGHYSPGGKFTPIEYPEIHHSHLVGIGNIFSNTEDLYTWYQALHSDKSWIPYSCGSAYGRGYGYSAAFIPIHDLNTVVIILSNFWDAPLDRMVGDIQEILLEDDLLELEVAELERFSGDYHALLPDGLKTIVTISRQDDHIFINGIGSNLLDSFYLYPLSQERFILKTEYGYGPLFVFLFDDNNMISQVIIDDVDKIELSLIE